MIVKIEFLQKSKGIIPPTFQTTFLVHYLTQIVK